MQKVSENITIFEEVPQVVLFALSLSLCLSFSLCSLRLEEKGTRAAQVSAGSHNSPYRMFSRSSVQLSSRYSSPALGECSAEKPHTYETLWLPGHSSEWLSLACTEVHCHESVRIFP